MIAGHWRDVAKGSYCERLAGEFGPLLALVVCERLALIHWPKGSLGIVLLRAPLLAPDLAIHYASLLVVRLALAWDVTMLCCAA
jgi:hypothetical protein